MEQGLANRFSKTMIRIENPHYLASGLSFGTSRRAEKNVSIYQPALFEHNQNSV
jgi:hypothetical protein